MNGGPNPLKHVFSSQGYNDTLPQSEGKPGPPEGKKMVYSKLFKI